MVLLFLVFFILYCYVCAVAYILLWLIFSSIMQINLIDFIGTDSDVSNQHIEEYLNQIIPLLTQRFHEVGPPMIGHYQLHNKLVQNLHTLLQKAAVLFNRCH